ncbi:MAG: sialate O-acetylesterase [Lacibacter sp.]
MKYRLFTVFAFFIAFHCSSQVRLPRLISNGMILQRDAELKIWGWASANEKVSVSFNSKQYSSSANEKGEWMIVLPKQKAGGPFNMTITGKNEILLQNILIGDVWVCGGQSNMELWMDRLKYKYADEIATVNNPFIRQFLVPDKYNFHAPQTDVDGGEWQEANTKNIGSFSGVAYFFAKEINAKYKIPVGIINAALGGSPAEAWISEEAIKKFPAYYNEAQLFKNDQLIRQIESKEQYLSSVWNNYANEFDEGQKQNWKQTSLNDNDWKQLTVPGYWADTDAGNFNGIVWFRKEINVPASMVGKPAKLELGRIVDADSVFINNRFVGTTGYQYPPRRYELPASVLKEGKNSIVIRVVSYGGKAGFVLDKRYELTTATDTVDLKGVWKYKTGIKAVAAPGQTFIRWKPVGLYNAMIAPLTNYQVKGILWYQGESNAGRPGDYKDLMQTLIEDWRSKWNQQLPFYYVQLANFMEAKTQPEESSWAALRQQQLNNLSVPNTGMAVIIDAGDWNDVHPEDKQTVGHRLALIAEKNLYGEKKLVASGPLYGSMKIESNKIILSFTNTGSGLLAKGNGELKQFSIAGADKKFVWAKAIIKGNTVIVWSDEIVSPVTVRYAWADNPAGANLYNKEGLPASPFTTDK